MSDINKIISNGKGYFTYLTEQRKSNPISIKDLSYEEIIQLYWREEINTGLLAWLTKESSKSTTNTLKQKHLIEDKNLDLTEKGICSSLNEKLFNQLGANLTRNKIESITNKGIGLFTHLKTLKKEDYNVYFLNRNMFYQLWWKEGITDKQLGIELVGLNERRIRTIRTEWYKVTYPFLISKDKDLHKFYN